MKYLIVSDIHSNWEALDSVLQDAEGNYDQLICLGDLVGYGPDPNLVVDWARQRQPIMVRGNHDRACTGMDDLENYSFMAERSAVWTSSVLTEVNSEYLRNLAQGPIAVEGFDLVHGSPKDEDEYLISINDAYAAFAYVQSQVTFFGHTHVQGGFQMQEGNVRLLPEPNSGSVLTLNQEMYYLINPGSVGQPRDRNRLAAYALFDPATGSVTFRRVDYKITATQRKIRAAGLPLQLADRLAIGH
jgi:predicted phosphodiesterase